MDKNIINIVFLTLIFVMLLVYLAIKIYFTITYFNYQVLRINSANDVISSQDLKTIISFYQKKFKLEKYEINFQETENFLTLNSCLNKKNHKINFSKRVFESVGFELDYILGTMWFIYEGRIKKNHRIRFYDFLNRFGFILNFTFFFLGFLTSLIIYLVVWVNFRGNPNNSGLMFLWNYPIIQSLCFFLFLNFFIIFYILLRVKAKIEVSYSQTLGDSFPENFKTYEFDLKAARNYAASIPSAHNLTFKTFNTNQKIKWLGPFVKN